MSNKTLQQKYQEKKLQETIVRARKAARVLKENRPDHHAKLLMEALDEEELKKASEVIEKLRKLGDTAEKFKLSSLAKAIDSAEKEVNEYVGGTGSSQFVQKVKSLFSRSTGANPVLKALALASALEQGFKQIPTILKNNIKDVEKKKEDTIQTILGTDEKTRKNISNTLEKAFVPEGIYGKIFNKIPYFENQKAFVQELMMNATPLALSELVKADKSGRSAEEIAPEVQQDVAGAKKGEGETNIDDKSLAIVPKDSAKAKKIIDIATQNAKKAGLDEKGKKALDDLLVDLEFGKGSLAHRLLIPTLKTEMAVNDVDDDQINGFVRGLMMDYEKFKNDFVNKMKEEAAKIKAKRQKEAERMGERQSR